MLARRRQDLDSGQRQRLAVLSPHFHAVSGEGPNPPFEIELAPFSKAQFARAWVEKRYQLQRGYGLSRALILPYRADQARKRLFVDQRGAVGHLWRGERPSQPISRIRISAGCRYGIAKNLTNCAANAPCGLVVSRGLDLAKHNQYVACADFCDWLVAERSLRETE